MATRGGRTEVLGGAEPPRRPDAALIRALRQAHAMLEPDRRGAPTLAASPGQPWRRKLIRLAFLAPDLQTAILDGRQPKGIHLATLTEREMPLAWAAQRTIFREKSGFRAAKP
jgi:hypothetical protein